MNNDEKQMKEINYMKKLNVSQIERILNLESENKRLTAAIKCLLQEKEEWIKSKTVFNSVVQQTLNDINEKNHIIANEMQQLRDENRKLKEANKRLRDE